MKRIHKTLTLVLLAMMAFLVSCGHPRRLESIEMQPPSATVTGPGASIIHTSRQFNAIGHFINPTETEIINDRVTWASDTPDISQVDQTGLVTTGFGACGTSLITATATRSLVGTGTSNAVVIGTATMTVNDTNNPACGGTATNAVLTVSVSNAGGSVTGDVNGSLTTIAGCTNTGGANCVAIEPLTTAVTLTFTTAPATVSANCTPLTATTCQVVLNSNQNVTVTF